MKGKKIHFKIKTGDTVKILRGKDAGKTGKITQVLPTLSRVVVDGINKTVRHLRPQKKGEKGQRVEFFSPIHVSNALLVCPKCNKPMRVRRHISKGEDQTTQKNRQCAKCKETFV